MGSPTLPPRINAAMVLSQVRCDKTELKCRNYVRIGFECPGYPQLQWNYEKLGNAEPSGPKNFAELVSAASAIIALPQQQQQRHHQQHHHPLHKSSAGPSYTLPLLQPSNPVMQQPPYGSCPHTLRAPDTPSMLYPGASSRMITQTTTTGSLYGLSPLLPETSESAQTKNLILQHADGMVHLFGIIPTSDGMSNVANDQFQLSRSSSTRRIIDDANCDRRSMTGSFNGHVDAPQQL
ncbi:hypothetical protein DL768_001089 [Monosporascus sp. mg162]|nr:hypothetical protein DL768_001089 [Monosporascus sp. mg162]